MDKFFVFILENKNSHILFTSQGNLTSHNQTLHFGSIWKNKRKIIEKLKKLYVSCTSKHNSLTIKN